MKIPFLFSIVALLWAQAVAASPVPPVWKGKKIGVYISSSGCSYTPDYAQDLFQWLSIGEDRSQQEQVKTEWIIRLGEQLTPALRTLSGADSVIFLNGDLSRGKAFMQSYDAALGKLKPGASLPKGLDEVVVIQKLTLKKRMANVAYVSSNRMVNERVPVMVAQLTAQRWAAGKPTPAVATLAFDARNSAKPSPLLVQFPKAEAGMALFFSQLFTLWWNQAG